jgi:hypothetical protein
MFKNLLLITLLCTVTITGIKPATGCPHHKKDADDCADSVAPNQHSMGVMFPVFSITPDAACISTEDAVPAVAGRRGLCQRLCCPTRGEVQQLPCWCCLLTTLAIAGGMAGGLYGCYLHCPDAPLRCMGCCFS